MEYTAYDQETNRRGSSNRATDNDYRRDFYGNDASVATHSFPATYADSRSNDGNVPISNGAGDD